MRLGLYQETGATGATPCLFTDRGLVPFGAMIEGEPDPQGVMEQVIDRYDALKPELTRLQAEGRAISMESVRILPPLPRPATIFSCMGNYWEHAQRAAQPLNMWLKNPDAVVGPGDVVRIPEFTDPWMFMHEAELGVVLKGLSKNVAEADWRKAVFGYTGFMDITARGHGRITWRAVSWLGKNFDTFAPIGPCITTADEILEPNDLHVRFWNDGQLRHNYNTDDMEHRVPELVAFVTSFMTVHSGDLIACGTNHEGLGPIQDGETLEIEIQQIGRMKLTVEDPLKRTWERGVYMGEDSTNHEAVRRHKPQAADTLKSEG
jgi:2-keto-4-pentenoate hydratase/2-oxohepta-3-ene-1,7-dioic acid hydratase in catechol pathway